MPFLGTETPHPNARSVVIPAPYERTTSYLKGTANGPRAILEASEQVEYFDSETGTEAHRLGIDTLEELNYSDLSDKDALALTEKAVKAQLERHKFPLLLGGEHTISIAPIRAVADHFGAEQISILHFDAHSDMREAYQGNKYSHASILRRAHEVVSHTYSIGIRAQCIEERTYLTEHKDRFGILYDHERASHGLSWEKAKPFLPTRKIYLTIDLDYFSPEVMPSVGTPVPGGGGWYETLHFLRQVFSDKEVVGADIVELKPDKDERSNFFAAQLAYKLITYRWLSSATL